MWHIKHRQWSHCLCAGQMCRWCQLTTAPHKCNAVEMSNGVLIVLWDVRVGGLHATIASISNLSQMRWQVVVYIYIHKRAARLTMSYWREIFEENIMLSTGKYCTEIIGEWIVDGNKTWWMETAPSTTLLIQQVQCPSSHHQHQPILRFYFTKQLFAWFSHGLVRHK